MIWATFWVNFSRSHLVTLDGMNKVQCGERLDGKRFLFGYTPGLPDGLFSYQKYQFGYILEGLGMENVGIF
jgi:hypothetical protein